ncbi:MAG: Pr6Pr family membrane protein [Sphingomicrobium sp.]
MIALIAWLALGVQAAATYGQGHDLAATLWILLRFFTVTTNLIVAIVMTVIALGRPLSPSVLGGATLAILLVGIIYMTLLRGMLELSGGVLLADTLLHKVTPLLVSAWWLVFAPKGELRWRDPLLWALYPLAYLIYALGRGGFDGRYPYPFLDIATLGVASVAVNSLLIAAGFLIAGEALVWLDARLAQSRSHDRTAG